LRELAGDYGVDGVWIDGDCWASVPDYSEAALKAFRQETGIEDVPRKPGEPHWFEFLQFNREAFRRYARYWYDAFAVVTWSDEQILEAFVWDGAEHLLEPTQRGKGVIAVLPHMGNWDAAGRAMQERGARVVSVAERLRPERLFRLFLEHREALGLEIHGLSGEGKVGRALSRALSDGKVVALVADRDLTGRGVEVEMFGGTRKLPAGPALLALSSGAPVITCALYQTPTGWSTTFRAPFFVGSTGDRRADVVAGTRRIAAAFEEAISASPSDWHLFQPGWEA
jgi:KDO2-lipid IV(A) lauroyltransferase